MILDNLIKVKYGKLKLKIEHMQYILDLKDFDYRLLLDLGTELNPVVQCAEYDVYIQFKPYEEKLQSKIIKLLIHDVFDNHPKPNTSYHFLKLEKPMEHIELKKILFNNCEKHYFGIFNGINANTFEQNEPSFICFESIEDLLKIKILL